MAKPVQSAADFAKEAFSVALGLVIMLPPKTEAEFKNVERLYVAMFEQQIRDRDEATRLATLAAQEALRNA